MEIHSVKIGNATAKVNVFLAPMAGYTDCAFRKLALNLGAGFCFTELVSAKGLCYGQNGSKNLLRCDGEEEKTAVQLFGADPYFMRKACESEDLSCFSVVDINMGCPVPKVFKNGEGSALLQNILLAEKIIKECVKSGKTVTVKIRTGIKHGDDVAQDFAIMAEQAGAKLITIHGRVREAYYSGEVDYNAIKKAKNSVSIPVIANGGIFTEEDADAMIERTGADGVMLARGAIADPFLFSTLIGKEITITKKEFILKHISLAQKYLDEKILVAEFRKFLPYYAKGLKNSKEIRQACNEQSSLLGLISVIKEKFPD